MEKKVIILGADHNGVDLKSRFVKILKNRGYTVIDIGPYTSDVSVDYVDYAKQIASIVSSDESYRGVLICGTGVGMSIAANRYPDIRAALVHNIETAPKCREHNDSNVICLGAWINEFDVSQKILDTWLGEPYAEGRHEKRIMKLHPKPQNKVVFTNGVFDILHKGHIELFKFSKQLGEKLIVAINDDVSVRKLKGPSRPVNSQIDRKKILDSIRDIDEVIIFDGELSRIREQINPHVVVKGGEWTSEEVRKRDKIPADTEIKIFPFLENYSTTGILKKAKSLKTWKKK